MPDGKSRNQYQHLLPIGYLIAQTQRHDEKDMVNPLPVGYVLPAEGEVQTKIIHKQLFYIVYRWKLISTFAVYHKKCLNGKYNG
jgi:hypothetical protein